MADLYAEGVHYKPKQTPTVGELMDLLSQFDRDLPVAYTWEGQVLPVDLGSIQLEVGGKNLAGPVVLLDAETDQSDYD